MPNALPSRLFELYETPQKSESGKLVYGIQRSGDYLRELSPTPKYCTVSYVWGETQYIDVESVGWKVSITSEEKLHFMLDACARQGFTYVWCDLLCIWQGNAEEDARVREDQLVELVKMQQYYAESSATIVLGQNYETFASRWAKVAPVLDIWAADRAATKQETLHVVWQCLGDIDNVIHESHGSWFWRVWTLQEAVVPKKATLRTTDGTEMNLPLLCDLIDWTYSALGTRTLNTSCGDARYDWIHPGQGVVNDRGWWIVSDNLKMAMSYRSSPIHPLQLLNITRFRKCFRPVDRLRGAYAMLDETWQVNPLEAEREVSEAAAVVSSNPNNNSLSFRIRAFLTKQLGCFGQGQQDWDEEEPSNEMGRDEREKRLFELTWEKTVDKYIEREDPDCAPLLTMRVRDDGSRRSWGIGEVQEKPWAETHLVGSVTAEFGKWINRTGKSYCSLSSRELLSIHCPPTLVREGPLKGALRLQASGIDNIQRVDHNYGDGSGELYKLLRSLDSLVKEHDIRPILVLLLRAIENSQRHYDKGSKPDQAAVEAAHAALEKGDASKALKSLGSVIVRNANAVSSGLRGVFSGWDRWIVATEDQRAFLVWFPLREKAARERLSKCSLLWPCPGHNDWAVLVEGTPKEGYRKVGVAFVSSTHPGPEVSTLIL